MKLHTLPLPRIIAILALLAAVGAALLLAGALPAAAQTVTDYDLNNNGLIDIGSIAQLDAIRYDADGDGDPSSTTTYNAAFPDRDTATSTRMGCPAGACTGYELTASLTFGATSTWTPINSFAATFDGGGRTITGMNVNVSSGAAGLFGTLAGSSRVRDLGLLDANVTSSAFYANAGTLAGGAESGVVLTSVYAGGGRSSEAPSLGILTPAGWSAS